MCTAVVVSVEGDAGAEPSSGKPDPESIQGLPDIDTVRNYRERELQKYIADLCGKEQLSEKDIRKVYRERKTK